MSTAVLKYFQEGIELHKSGSLEEAAYKYYSFLEKTVNQSENLSKKTSTNISSKRYKAIYSGLKIDNKYKAYANFNLASIRFQQFRYDEAIHYYIEGLKFAPKNFGAHIDLAKTYEMTGQWDDALYHINESLKVIPNHTTALRRKKRILEEKSFYESLHKKLKLEVKNFRINNYLTLQADYEIERNVCELLESLMECVYLELNSEFDFQPEEPLKIILFYDSIYNSSSMSLPRWVAGAYDNGSIKILLRTTERIHLGIIYVLLRHEYVHKIVEKLSNDKCPRWFNEGLSECIARKMFDFEFDVLQEAVYKNQHISLNELEQRFMMPQEKVRLAYIQARSIVESIIKEIGINGICKLLRKIGNSQIEGCEVIYQFLKITPEQLEDKWLKSKKVKRQED